MDSKNAVFARFSLVLLVFLFPILREIYFFYSLHLTGAGRDPTTTATLSMGLTLWGTWCWLLLCGALYCCTRWLVLTWGGKVNTKSTSQHKNDIIRLMPMLMSLASIGRCHARLVEGPRFALEIVLFTLLYVVMFEVVKALDFRVTARCFNEPHTFITFVVVVLTIMAFVHHTLVLACDAGFAMEFIAACVSVLTAHTALITSNGAQLSSTSGETCKRTHRTHIHHYYWPWVLAHACVFPSALSRTACAMFVATHLHGAALFGVEPLFYPTITHQD